MDQDNREIEPVEQPDSSENPTEEVEETQLEPVSESTEIENQEVEQSVPKSNEAWAKLRVENKRLKEQLTQTGVDSDYLEQLRSVTKPYTQQPRQSMPYDNEITPDSDVDTVIREVRQAREEAQRARADVQSSRREWEDQIAEERFPELKTDDLFMQLVAEKRLAAEVLGKKRTTVQIAQEVSDLLKTREAQVEQKTRETDQRRSVVKAQAQTDVVGQTSGGVSTQNDDELRMRIARGDMDALTSRLKNNLLKDLEF